MHTVQFLTAIFSNFSATGMTNSTGTDGTAGTMFFFVVTCFFISSIVSLVIILYLAELIGKNRPDM